jgi:phospholipid transport system substrate-binding protein
MKQIFAPSLALALAAVPAAAVAAEPAAATVETLHGGLLSIMRAGGSSAARARTIGPVIDRTFDIPLMTRLAVGPKWTSIPAAQQSDLVEAFRDLTVSQYVKNFDSYGGEKFVMGGVDSRGADKLVRTTLDSGGKSETLDYRLRNSGGTWKIVDVYFRSAISQLATRRADFARVLDKGGASALIAHLNRLAAKGGDG